MSSITHLQRQRTLQTLATGVRNLDKEGLMSSLRLKADDFGYIAPEDMPRGVGAQRVAASEVRPIDEVEEFTKSKEDVVQDLVDRKFSKDNGPFPDTVDDYMSAPTGAGLEAIKSVKNNSLIVDDLVDKVYQMSGVAENAKPVARANARDFLNRVKDLEDPEFPGGTTLSRCYGTRRFKICNRRWRWWIR
jgi:hypothetical protein